MAVLSLSDAAYSTFHCLANGNREPRIHIVAHIAGAISGILLGFIFYQGTGKDRENNLKFVTLQRASAVLYVSFIILVIVINVV